MIIPSKVNTFFSLKKCMSSFDCNFCVLVWEISTGRCIKTIDTGDIVRSVAWCPNAKISLIAVATGQRLILLNPKVGDKMLVKKTDEILIEAPKIDTLGKNFVVKRFF